MRFLNVCPALPTGNDGSEAGYEQAGFNYGNTAYNLNVSGGGTGGNDDLGFSCQRHGYIADINDHGFGTAIYKVYGVTVSNYNFSPWDSVDQTTDPGYYITNSSDVTISNFTSSGQGGVISGGTIANANQITYNTTINNEKIYNSNASTVLKIIDAYNTTINNSQIPALQLTAISPTMINGINVAGSTTVGSVNCDPTDGTGIMGLPRDISCTQSNAFRSYCGGHTYK
jgi:hypothetical protein